MGNLSKRSDGSVGNQNKRQKTLEKSAYVIYRAGRLSARHFRTLMKS